MKVCVCGRLNSVNYDTEYPLVVREWKNWNLIAFCSTLYKADTSLKRTNLFGPVGVRFREVLLYSLIFSYSFFIFFHISYSYFRTKSYRFVPFSAGYNRRTIPNTPWMSVATPFPNSSIRNNLFSTICDLCCEQCQLGFFIFNTLQCWNMIQKMWYVVTVQRLKPRTRT